MTSFSASTATALGGTHTRSPYRGVSPSKETATRSSQYHAAPHGLNRSPKRYTRGQTRGGAYGEDESHVYVNSAVQTEACFPPRTFAGIGEHYQHLASEQLKSLHQFRHLIQCGVAELAGTAYDIVAYKDVMLKMEEQFRTGLPLTDLLVLSSKLFRHTSELARQLNCFFGVVFAEDYSDPHFHFTELRIALRELAEAKSALADAQEERDKLRLMLDEVAVVSMQQTKTVEMLEHRNQAVSQHKTALEDQLAILFHQVADAFKDKCEGDLSSVNNGLGALERTPNGRATVTEAMDAVMQQLQASRTTMSDMKDSLFGKGDVGLLAPAVAGKNAKGKNGSAQFSERGKRGNDPHDAAGDVSQVRLQFKTLEMNITQLLNRLGGIKEEVVSSAIETQAAMNERKRSLYMSLQHIRLYEVQNAKLRYSRALFQSTRRHWMELLPRIEKTIGSRITTLIDPLGNIVSNEGITHRVSGGGNELSSPPGNGVRPAVSAFVASSQPLAKNGSSEQTSPQQAPQSPSSAAANPPTRAETPTLGVAPFTSTREMLLHLHEVGDLLQEMELTFDTDDEHKAFLQLISLAVPTSGRGDISADSALRRFSNAALEKSLHPSEKAKSALSGTAAAPAKGPIGIGGVPIAAHQDGRASPSDGARDPMSGNNRRESTQATQARFQEQLHDMHAEFAVKLELLRQVYEGRIAELEIKESSFQRQLEELQKLLSSDSSVTLAAPPREERTDATKDRVPSASPKKLKGKKGTVSNLQALRSADSATAAGASKRAGSGKKLNDRDAVVSARRDFEVAGEDGSLEAQAVSKFDVVTYTDEIDKTSSGAA